MGSGYTPDIPNYKKGPYGNPEPSSEKKESRGNWKWKPYALAVLALAFVIAGIYSIFGNKGNTNKEADGEFKKRGKTELVEGEDSSLATPEDKQELEQKVSQLSKEIEKSGSVPNYYVKQNQMVPYETVSGNLKKFEQEHGKDVKVSLVLQPDGKIFKNNYQILNSSESSLAISELSRILGEGDSAHHVEKTIRESSGANEIQISGNTVKVQSVDSLKHDYDAFYSPQLMQHLLDYAQSSAVKASSGKTYITRLPLLIIDPSGRILCFTVVDQTKNYSVVEGAIQKIGEIIGKYATRVSRKIGMLELQKGRSTAVNDVSKLRMMEQLQKEHTAVSNLQRKLSRRPVSLNTARFKMVA